MKFDWQLLVDALARMGALALQWYRVVNNLDEAEGTRQLAVLSAVLDPNRPEQTASEVVKNGG